MDLASPELVKYFQELFTSGVAISPLLAGVNSSDRFDPAVGEVLDLEAEEFTALNWPEKEVANTFGTLPVPDKFPKKSLYETAAATAVLLAHEQTGDTLVEEGVALEAMSKVKGFAEKHGLGVLLLLYRAVTAYDNMNALAYYGKIPERKFLLGKWHRPWIDHALSDELLMGILTGYYQILIEDGMRYVSLTKQGHQAYEDLSMVLEDAGYFKKRMSLLRISQFNYFDDYENLAIEIWPESMSVRKHLLDWAGIEQGMRVLEVGCGSGPLTFEGGLADIVGPEGVVTATDPSFGMLYRARNKKKARYPWVEFKQARAEDLPFEDASFDAAIGVAFMHFADLKAAAHEMKRVTRAGGVIASCHPLEYNYDVSFFREWFHPVFEMAARKGGVPKSFFFLSDDVPKAFEIAGISGIEVEKFGFPTVFHDPEKVIRHFIYGIGLFQDDLADLPWKAREELIETLKDTGAAVCRKYPRDERIIQEPTQNVKGVS